MSSATKRSRSSTARNRPAAQTRVSAYDRVSSLLISLLALVGLAVVLLFLFWLTKLGGTSKRTPDIVPFDFAGRGDHALGEARDLEEPGVEELADVIEPQLSETLEAVTDAISSVQGAVESFEGQAAELGTGSGLGDSRESGPGGEGDGGAPWEHWEVRFSTVDKKTYASQLQSFGIELGAIGGSNEVDYASNLDQPKPTSRSAPSAEEKRVYFSFTTQNATLRAWDRQLLESAGVSTRGRQWLQFVPNTVLQQLLALELQKAGEDRTIEDIQKTVFGVRPSGGKFEFYVIEQQYFFGR